MKTIYFDVITQLNGFMVVCPKIVCLELAEFLDDSFLVSVVEVRLRLKNESAKIILSSRMNYKIKVSDVCKLIETYSGLYDYNFEYRREH